MVSSKARNMVLSMGSPSLPFMQSSQESVAVLRDRFIAECLKTGGRSLVESVRQYGVNEKGEPIRLSGWFEEVLLLLGDFRIAETHTSGSAQIGKTLAHTMLLCHCLTEGNLNAMWAYDMQKSRDIQVKANFWPVIEGRDGASGWIGKKGIQKKTGGASQNINVYQVAGGEVQFPYVSTNKAKQGRAAASGTNVGVSRDLIIKEERSQYAPGAGDVLNRRLDASRIPTRPIRNNGTPASGLGIEADIKNAPLHFYPHCTCPKCDRSVPLDPFGSLLKPAIATLENGEQVKQYLSDSGRPLDWFRHDDMRPTKTAYFGCPYCEGVLTNEARSLAWYQCLKTGQTLREYLNALPSGVPEDRQEAAIEISPLLRVEATNTAADIIRAGLNQVNTDDWCQQRLGKPSESGGTGITIRQLQAAIARAIPECEPDVTLAGMDVGRSGDVLMIADIWLPAGWEELPLMQVKEKALRRVKFCKVVNRTETPALLEHHGVRFGLLDGEPDIPAADLLGKETVMVAADQKTTMGSAQVEKATRMASGEKYRYWKINQKDFQNDVLMTYSKGLVSLSGEWEKHLALFEAEDSPVRHLLAMKRDPETRIWQRPADRQDHTFFSQMFLEAAFTIWLMDPLRSASIDPIGGFSLIDLLRT